MNICIVIKACGYASQAYPHFHQIDLQNLYEIKRAKGNQSNIETTVLYVYSHEEGANVSEQLGAYDVDVVQRMFMEQELVENKRMFSKSIAQVLKDTNFDLILFGGGDCSNDTAELVYRIGAHMGYEALVDVDAFKLENDQIGISLYEYPHQKQLSLPKGLIVAMREQATEKHSLTMWDIFKQSSIKVIDVVLDKESLGQTARIAQVKQARKREQERRQIYDINTDEEQVLRIIPQFIQQLDIQ